MKDSQQIGVERIFLIKSIQLYLYLSEHKVNVMKTGTWDKKENNLGTIEKMYDEKYKPPLAVACIKFAKSLGEASFASSG